MIQDKEITKAISRILQRSERQADLQKLVASFVDIGVLPQLDNNNNQILYGRRGTGKTHVMKVLQSVVGDHKQTITVYIDSRTLGSTSQFSDPSIAIGQRCLLLFKDILGPIHDSIYEWVLENAPKNAMDALNEADKLAECIVQPIKTVTEKTIETGLKQEHATARALDVAMKKDPSVTLTKSDSIATSESTSTSYAVKSEDKIIFPALHDTLTRLLEMMDCSLCLLLDEWSSLPLDIQPFLAEFLKRGVLPIQRATVKIGALEYRSRFSTIVNGITYGFELGADIATAVDLDDYYVIDRNPEALTTLYADMLLRHLNVDLPDGYLREKYDITTGNALASKMFTERATFRELARAAEGVVRDLINIFSLAYFHAQRRTRDSIDRQSVIEAARQWFEQDKQTHLDDVMQSVLRKIVDEVIGKRRARSFLLPRELQRHPMIQRLFDARVLHQMQRGYADKDNPGVRYNIYTLDYGTYVDLLGTSRQPEENPVETEGNDVIVPFDDKRSIRRIILTKENLD